MSIHIPIASRRTVMSAVISALAITSLLALASPALAASAHPPVPAPSPTVPALRQSGPIPFTSATLDPASTGTWTVSWTAPGVRSVNIYLGSNANEFSRIPVAHGDGDGSGSATISTTDQRPWVELVPDVGSPLTIASRDLGLASDPNLRDAGGYRTTDGQWVKMGVLYRSAALTLTPADLAVVNTLGITADYDLRTPAESAAAPDVVPSGATYQQLNVFGQPSVPVPSLTSVAQAEQTMETYEQQFVTLPSAQQAYHTLFTDIANAQGAVLYHCSAGKDRTGWASAVLLTLLGVPQSTVTQDYLLSNQYYLDSPAVQAELASLPSAEASIYTQLLDVAPAYLNAGFAQVTKSFGSVYNYAVHGLGLSPLTIDQLKAKLLEGTPTTGRY